MTFKYYDGGAGGPFFTQDSADCYYSDLPPIPERFGLIDGSSDRWTKFWQEIFKLNENEDGLEYKVFFLGRHGEAVNNLYGVQGDKDLTWGPDPELTQDGYHESRVAHAMWVKEVAAGIGLPKISYCSPFTRCMVTNTITFGGLPGYNPTNTIIVENCREVCYYQQLPDKRRTKHYIDKMFPNFTIDSDPNHTFSEDDELWKKIEKDGESESEESVEARVTDVLSRIFSSNGGQFVSITTHHDYILAFLNVIQRKAFSVREGGVLPVIIVQSPDDSSSSGDNEDGDNEDDT